MQRKHWAPSDRTLLLAKVKELGIEKGCEAVGKILQRTVASCKAMWYHLQQKRSTANKVPPKANQEIEMSFKDISIDLKNKKLIIKL